jgi:hypothetical protein
LFWLIEDSTVLVVFPYIDLSDVLKISSDLSNLPSLIIAEVKEYSNINTDINISWTTSLGQFYYVLSPSKTTIYTVLGDIEPNAGKDKYKINSKGTEQIDISVLNVSQNDGSCFEYFLYLLKNCI